MREPRDEELARRAGAALRQGVRSSAASRDRIMQLVREEPLPARGRGDGAGLGVLGDLAVPRRSIWRSPAIALLAAASIAGFVALVHARSVAGPIPAVPGHPGLHGSAPATASAPASAPSHAGAVPAAPAAHAAARPGETLLARVQFVFVAPTAQRVSVVGDFNDWDPAAAPMAVAGGVWSRELDVPVGRHDYAFIVDGSRWVADPTAPRAPADELGGGYSVLVVGGER